MKINLNGAVLAGSVWLAAAVLAWPAAHPYAALLLLATHAAIVIALG